MKHLSLIGAAVGCGAQKTQTEQGPDYLQKWGLSTHLQQAGLEASWIDIITTCSVGTPIERVRNVNETLAKVVSQIYSYPSGFRVSVESRATGLYGSVHEDCELDEDNAPDNLRGTSIDQTNTMPIIIGGDHSIAIGTWSGMKGTLGLIWIDAHMDAHTFETTPSQAIHGMPVAVLLGAGEETLVNLHHPGPKIQPEHLVLIGIRSFEEGEAAFLQAQGVRIFYMEEVQERGFDVVLREAIELIASKTDRFGLTIDLDAFDPADAPGVGSPEGYGLRKQEVLPSLHLVGEHAKFCALEIAEYNPIFDEDNKTAFLVQHIIFSMFSKQ